VRSPMCFCERFRTLRKNFGEVRTAVLAGSGKRDLRLDLLRGTGQWIVFLDHIPDNFLNWFTIRNYGFSDAASPLRSRSVRLSPQAHRQQWP
jgi:hypothetical protein